MTKEINKELVAKALEEAMKRYPESISALIWFATASGLNEEEPNEEQLAWARSTLKGHQCQS